MANPECCALKSEKRRSNSFINRLSLPPYFCMVQHVSVLRAHLLQEQLELTMIQATRPNEVHCLHDRGAPSVVNPTKFSQGNAFLLTDFSTASKMSGPVVVPCMAATSNGSSVTESC
ncbi:hypothetical protein NQZ68_008327 [Dissostichus eleginoides]|nr:hypothetical protein NQZ68_008327 [Dissostichus eleginoides]